MFYKDRAGVIADGWPRCGRETTSTVGTQVLLTPLAATVIAPRLQSAPNNTIKASLTSTRNLVTLNSVGFHA